MSKETKRIEWGRMDKIKTFCRMFGETSVAELSQAVSQIEEEIGESEKSLERTRATLAKVRSVRDTMLPNKS